MTTDEMLTVALSNREVIDANRHSIKFLVWLVAATFTLIGFTIGCMFRMHKKTKDRQTDILDALESYAVKSKSEIELLRNYANHTLSVSLDTDHKMDEAKKALDVTPDIKDKIDILDRKVEETPARTVAALQQQSASESGHSLPTVNIEADTVNVTPAPVTDTIPKPPPAATTRQFAKPPE